VAEEDAIFSSSWEMWGRGGGERKGSGFFTVVCSRVLRIWRGFVCSSRVHLDFISWLVPLPKQLFGNGIKHLRYFGNFCTNITVLEFTCIMHSHQFYIGAKLSQAYIQNLRETIFDMVNFKSFSLQSQFCDNVISNFVYTCNQPLDSIKSSFNAS
jgi:hypothetical protein